MHASFANTSEHFCFIFSYYNYAIDSSLLFIVFNKIEIEMALIGMINNTCQNDLLEVGQIDTPSI